MSFVLVGDLYTLRSALDIVSPSHIFLKGGLLVYQSSTNTMAQTTNTNPIAMSQPQIRVFRFFFLCRSIHVSLLPNVSIVFWLTSKQVRRGLISSGDIDSRMLQLRFRRGRRRRYVIGYRSLLFVEVDGHGEASPELGVANAGHLVFGEVWDGWVSSQSS